MTVIGRSNIHGKIFTAKEVGDIYALFMKELCADIEVATNNYYRFEIYTYSDFANVIFRELGHDDFTLELVDRLNRLVIKKKEDEFNKEFLRYIHEE